jgi:hypothetical protein
MLPYLALALVILILIVVARRLIAKRSTKDS